MIIEKVNTSHKSLIRDFATACAQDSTENYARALRDSDEYIDFLIARSTWVEPSPEGWLPSITYYAIEGEQILGAIRIRSGKNDTADNIVGYIGLETRPAARNSGVATMLLTWLKCNIITQPTIITCEENNLASKGLLEKNGAEFVGDYFDDKNQVVILRYVISPSNQL